MSIDRRSSPPLTQGSSARSRIRVDTSPKESYSMKPLVTSVCELRGGAR